MTFTKAEIADNLQHSAKLKLDAKLSKSIVASVFENIRVALESGEDVKISGFGNFKIRDKSPRPGLNPRTGETVEVCSRRVVTFLVGQKLKSAISSISKS